jgi:RimJ/RimL family protein N-acetyltransferase
VTSDEFDLQPNLKANSSSFARSRLKIGTIFLPSRPLECGGAFVIIDTKSQQTSDPRDFTVTPRRNRRLKLDGRFLARRYWGGRYNRELKQLMLADAFKFVGNVVFYVGQTNVRSQKATEKIGGIRNGMVEKTYRSGQSSLSVKYVIKKPVTC